MVTQHNKKNERYRTLHKKLFRRESKNIHTPTHLHMKVLIEVKGKVRQNFHHFEIKINNGIFANERSIYIRGRVWTAAARSHGPRCESSSSVGTFGSANDKTSFD